MRKSQILEYLGEDALHLPHALQDALMANDRVKYLFTLLQAARLHADVPEAASAHLAVERDVPYPDMDYDTVVEGSWREGRDVYHIPKAGEIFGRIVAEIEAMIKPLDLAKVDDARHVTRRLHDIKASGEVVRGSTVNGSTIDWITGARRNGTDTPHLLVMDAHRALNNLQAMIAQESVDGAHVYGLEPSDYPYVRAFMVGVNRTSPLKFDHPGLSTTATRSKGSLIVQNDIGTTDAHVFVVRVTELMASFTYTDVHRLRAEFFQRMLADFAVDWQLPRTAQSDRLAGGEPFYVAVGRYEATDQQAMYDFLEYLASRLVFLIDWNRARKRLRRFMRKATAVQLLDWAAVEEVGHRAFLQLGGEQLVLDAFAAATAGQRPTGDRLDKILGADTTLELFKSVLRTTCRGLLADRSERLIRDEVRAEFLATLETAQESLLDLAYDQSALIADLADRVRSGVYRAKGSPDPTEMSSLARRAKEWERRADEIVIQARGILQGTRSNESYSKLFSEIDVVADGLEEAVFLLTLLPRVTHSSDLYEPLMKLADLTVRGVRAFVTCIESARHVHRGASRGHTQDFLEAVDMIVTIEREADAAERFVIAELYGSANEFRQLHLFGAIAAKLEEATDAVTRCAHTLRELVLSDLATGVVR